MAKRILVVDDNAEFREIATIVLQSWGHLVLTAIDGKKGLDIIKEEKPDLVLLDIGLPTMDGYEVCRRVKADDGLKDIPIIFCTGEPASQVVREIRGCGANDYIIKPFDFEELFIKIHKFI